MQGNIIDGKQSPFDRLVQSVKYFTTLQTSFLVKENDNCLHMFVLGTAQAFKKQLGGRRFNLQNSFLNT